MSWILLIFAAVAVNAVVVLLLTRFVHTLPIAVIASVTITELLCTIWAFWMVAHSSDAPDILYLAAQVTVVVTFPFVVLSSIGFVILVRRFERKKSENNAA
jgi:hypothetical protein